MQRKYKSIHTLNYALYLTAWWGIYVLNWKLEFLPNWVAFIFVGIATMGLTLCWKAYMNRDAQLDYTFEEILKNLPANLLVDMVNKRSDIKAEIVDKSQDES